MSLKQLSCVVREVYKYVVMVYMQVYSDMIFFFNDGGQFSMTHMICGVI